ncbi:MAG: hypothetical protein HWE22_15415 [Flavobacteriales bacterium]|nr:hypothetical protein [Flavobacteriales bacterium]
MKKEIIARIDKLLYSSTSELSKEDRLELENIRELIRKARTKEDVVEMAKELIKVIGLGMEFLM